MSVDTVMERGNPWDEVDTKTENLSPKSADRASLRIPSLSSQPGITGEDVPKSLKNPPTEFRPELHPGVNSDSKHKETEQISNMVDRMLEKDPSGLRLALPEGIDRNTGESKLQKKIVTMHERRKSAAAVASTTHNHTDGADASAGKEKAAKPTLLLVEDNLINQKVLKRQLQSRGFVVTTANNGQEAIDAVKALTATSDHQNSEDTSLPAFSCILMDQEMPVMDGNSATLAIRELMEANTVGWGPIIGVSANVREEQHSEMLGAGMDEVISKPFKVDELVSLVKRVVGKGTSLRKAISREGWGVESEAGSTETLVPPKQADDDRE
jgi:CheY-like chemotaxis protein